MKQAQQPVSRRNVLRTAAAAAPVATIGMSAEPAFADAKNLQPATLASLTKIARDIFPHDRLADKYYAAAVAGYDTLAADPAKKALIEDGVARLDADAKARYGVAGYAAVNWEADRVALLQAIAHTPFFAKLRGDLVVTLYNQKELWPKFGYEGSSAEQGGYINRGFADIDWLPV